ncbi:MAG: guanylate kinase [Abitibacteriaceae bacterium]|nr:guanylate kinase [Abditibacteriaceae bacterium]MBV9867163.1 guanylate kinase [Abditibacteriaceae bacterium]
MNAQEPTRRVAGLTDPTAMLLVISGPAGVGKDTVWKAASDCLPTFAKAVTCTTRPRREGEVDGVNYHFVSDDEFDRLLNEDQLLEWAHVHGNRYGVPQSSVLGRLNDGLDVVCVIDVQGAQRIRSLFPWSLLVFLKPPEGREIETLTQRIEQRGSVNEAEVKERINTWRDKEKALMPLYDYQIVNEEVATAARELCDIVEQEKHKRTIKNS